MTLYQERMAVATLCYCNGLLCWRDGDIEWLQRLVPCFDLILAIELLHHAHAIPWGPWFSGWLATIASCCRDHEALCTDDAHASVTVRVASPFGLESMAEQHTQIMVILTVFSGEGAEQCYFCPW
jgi:hypothetical protein